MTQAKDDPTISSPMPAASYEGAITTPDELERALKAQPGTPRRRLGQLLLDHALISAEELDSALQFQAENHDLKLGEILISMHAITLRDIQHALAEKLGIPYVNVRQFPIPNKIRKLVTSSVATSHQILPLMRSGGSLVVAVENPLDFEFQPELQFIANMHVIPVISDSDDLHTRIAREYGDWDGMDLSRQPINPRSPSLADTQLEDLTKRLSSESRWEDARDETLASEMRVNDNTLVRLVNKMVLDAHQRRASDIHIENSPGQNIKIRFRVDGMLHDYLNLQPAYRRAIVSRIKVMSNLDISEHRLAQDGKIRFERFGPLKIELRVAIIPTTDGSEDVVMRLLGGAEPRALAQLELGDEQLNRLLRMIQRSHGLILVCGPTGSGKTTTLHSVLKHINQPDRKIWTAEDPIEIAQSGLRQVQVNPRIGWTFARAMRAFLRADPDVIMVGEMRDAETSDIGIEASLTGHLVFSTLHTNSASESVVRLLEMGMDPFNFSDALIGILSQRLARRLCQRCRQPRLLSEQELLALAKEYCNDDKSLDPAEVVTGWRQDFGEGDDVTLYEAQGCEKCDNGYHGRIGIYELLSADEEVQQLIRTHGTVPQIREAALRGGMRLLRQDALQKVLRGLIDLPSARAVAS